MNGKKFLKLMFSLDEFVIPSIIRVLYILSFLFIILYSLYDAFGDIRYSFRSLLSHRKYLSFSVIKKIELKIL